MEQKITLYIVPHSHIDLEWYWTIEDTEAMLPELFYDSALPAMAEDSKLTFAQDQALLFELLMKNASEDQRAQIKALVQTNRLEPVGGMYVQPELQAPCGEALIRQIKLGQHKLEEMFGRRAVCAWHTDSFGQIDQMPQILRQSGFDSYVFMRDIAEADDPEHFPTEFYYEGPDGTKILTHWLKHSYLLRRHEDPKLLLQIGNLEITKENQKQALKKLFAPFLDENSLQRRTGLALLLWGDDLYPLRENAAQIKALLIEAAAMAEIGLREEDILFATPSEFFEALKEKAPALPVKSNDLGTPKYRQDLRGTYVTRIGAKLFNRQAEQSLLSLEALLAAAGKPAETEDLWEPLLFNQFHDTLAGSCVDEVYAAALNRYMTISAEAGRRKQAVFGKASTKDMICVFNPTQFERTDPVALRLPGGWRVETLNGELLPARYDAAGLLEFRPILEPYSAACYRLRPTETVPFSFGHETAVETTYYRLEFDPVTGDLLSIWDKLHCREVLQDTGNVIVAMEEENPDMEGGLCLTGRRFRDLGLPATAMRTVYSPGALCVEVEKDLCGFQLKKQVILWKDCRRIDFVTHILNFPGSDLLLQTEFPMAFASPKSLFETPFSVREGRVGLHCAQNWAGLEENGFHAALLNKGTCGYFVRENRLGMALLRGHANFTQYGENGRTRGLPRFADGMTHAELAAERGDHCFSYALVSGTDSIAAISGQAQRFNAPPEAFPADTVPALTPILTQVSEDLLITSLSRTGNGTLCLRGYHAAREHGVCQIKFAASPIRVRKVDLAGRPLGAVSSDSNEISLALRPFEIVTLLIDL